MNKTVDINKTRIGVVGGGSWGTALAKLLADKGFVLDLWVFEQEVKEQIEKDREKKILCLWWCRLTVCAIWQVR